jgi:hypothetical protein
MVLKMLSAAGNSLFSTRLENKSLYILLFLMTVAALKGFNAIFQIVFRDTRHQEELLSATSGTTMLETQPSSHFMKTLASHPRRTNILSDWACTLVTWYRASIREVPQLLAEIVSPRTSYRPTSQANKPRNRSNSA